MNRGQQLQSLITSISGYNAYDGFTSVKCDYYYDNCFSRQDKIEHLIAYAEEWDNITPTVEEASRVYDFLEAESEMDQTDRHYAFVAFDIQEEEEA